MLEGKFAPFFRGADFKVKSSDTKRERRSPKIEVNNEALFVALRLAKAGYFQGNPDNILQAPVDTVLNILHYEAFDNDYFEASRKMSEDKE